MRRILLVALISTAAVSTAHPATGAELTSATISAVEVTATGTSGNRTATVEVVDGPVHLECPPPSHQFCLDPQEGNLAVVNIDFGTPMADIDRLCVAFRFQGDLVDPGEGIMISFDPLGSSGSSAFGFENVGSSPISEREVCLVGGVHPEVEAFLDGQETGYVFVTRSSIYAMKPGKGCGDGNHLHERRAGCI